MRNDTSDDTRREAVGPVPGGWGQQATRRAAGATVAIPARPAAAAPVGPATLHARLALLRPQPLSVRPAVRTET